MAVREDTRRRQGKVEGRGLRCINLPNLELQSLGKMQAARRIDILSTFRQITRNTVESFKMMRDGSYGHVQFRCPGNNHYRYQYVG